MLYISYGQPKSASTFVTQLIDGIIGTQTGISSQAVREKFLPERLWHHYQELNGDQFSQINSLIPPKAATYFKSHLPPDNIIKRMVEANLICACASFRDPRDIALSILDAAARDRANGTDRPFFTSKYSIGDTLKPIARQIDILRQWLEIDNVLLIPYKMIANNAYFVARSISNQLGYHDLRLDHVVDTFLSDKSNIAEFNKGVEDRYKTEMSEDDLNLFSEKFSSGIAEVRALTESVMGSGSSMFSQYHRHVLTKRIPVSERLETLNQEIAAKKHESDRVKADIQSLRNDLDAKLSRLRNTNKQLAQMREERTCILQANKKDAY